MSRLLFRIAALISPRLRLAVTALAGIAAVKLAAAAASPPSAPAGPIPIVAAETLERSAEIVPTAAGG